MKRTVIVITVVTALTISTARPDAQGDAQDDILRTWLAAVAQHRPGNADAAASLAAQWTAGDLERLLPGLLFYLEQVRAAESRNQANATCASCAVSKEERERLLRESKPRVAKPQQVLISSFPHPDRLNALLQRAVSLHSDAAMLFPKNAGRLKVDLPGRPSTNVLRAPREVVQSSDGQYLGTAPAVPHWHMARALLHFTLPEPGLDASARRWYLATSTYLAATSELAEVSPHFEVMRALFPDDATVMFDLGWLAESHSTPWLQTHLRALVDAAARRFGVRPGPGLCNRIVCDASRNPYGIKNERASLIDAERFFARAVALNPDMAEAHVRLAFTRTRLGRHAEAEAALGKLAASEDPLVNFYSALVHGMALEALDRLDEAAGAYQTALDMFPAAQSVNLTMSALQQKRGDTILATQYAQRGIDPPPNQTAEFDPMIPYRIGRGRHVREAWAAYYAALPR